MLFNLPWAEEFSILRDSPCPPNGFESTSGGGSLLLVLIVGLLWRLGVELVAGLIVLLRRVLVLLIIVGPAILVGLSLVLTCLILLKSSWIR